MAEYSFNNNNDNPSVPQNDSVNTSGNTNTGTGAQSSADPYAAYAARYGTPNASGANPQNGTPVNGEYHSGYGGSYNPHAAGKEGTQQGAYQHPYESYSYGSGYQNGSYQNGSYQNGSYQDGAYQNRTYQNTSYQNGAYRSAPYQNNGGAAAPKKKKSNAGIVALLVVVCLLTSALSGFGGVLIGKGLAGDGSISTTHPQTPGVNDVGSVVVVNPSDDVVTTGTYSDVANAVKETVVEIRTESVQTGSYFGQYIKSGAGSGVILSSDGLILTNYHVIEGATKITVRLTNGTEYAGTVVGSDSESDIALVRIDATGLKHPVIGNSDAVIVGQEVVAIGNPLGELGGSVTNGIISALNRKVQVEGETMNLLQTNTAINPGNSGGGLFNLKGELIGIVNAKSSGTGIEGLGFAIPINDAMAIITELSEYGYVRGRVHLGIELREITEITMQYYYAGFTKPGLYVMDPGQTELKKYDRIVAADDMEISSYSELKAILRQHQVGDTMTLTVVRNNRNVTVTVTCYEYVPEGADSTIKFEGSGN